jgi:hypothetical protein
LDLAPSVRLTQPILNCEIRRAVVPCLKGRIRRGVPPLISVAETKLQLGPGRWGSPVVSRRRPVITPGRPRRGWAVAGRPFLRHTPASIEIPATAAAIGGLDNG